MLQQNLKSISLLICPAIFFTLHICRVLLLDGVSYTPIEVIFTASFLGFVFSFFLSFI